MIKYIILAVIVIVILSFLGYDLREIVESPLTQNNLSYAWEKVTGIWNSHLERPILYFWNNIFLGIIWKAIVYNLQKIDAETPSEFWRAAKDILNIDDKEPAPSAN